MYIGEQQSGSLIIKRDMLAVSLSEGPIQLRLYEASGPHMQRQQTYISRKLFAKKAAGNSSLTELAQKEGGGITFHFLGVCCVGEVNSYVTRRDIFTRPDMHRSGIHHFHAFLLLLLGRLFTSTIQRPS